MVSGLAAVAQANPHGGTVVAGAATITRAGRTLTVNQTSDRAIINWQGFSIRAGETTQINLPSSLSAILNRVTGADPSLIAGHLTSNGRVYLINPNGIVVGPNGRIDTSGFVASTLNLPNDAFMQGGAMTFKGDSGAGIQVLGSVTASNGDVVLIAAMIDNQGHIAAPNGQAILGAGGEVFYIPDGQSDIVIKAPAANGAGGVTNSGTIAAASVQMKAAGSAYALAVNNSGLVSATGISQHGDRIVLDGGDGDVVQSGTLAAAGGAVSVNGGRVTVSGTVDVSAPTGGGSIAVTASRNATVTSTAKLKASATTKGNGGSITVKAQGDAEVTGSLEAKGGPQGGDGGSAEISASTVTYHGQIDLTAPQGQIGKFLIDPADIIICFTCSLTPADIVAGLVGSDLTVQATNSITVNTAVSSNSAQTLFLDAPNTTLNAGISLPNGTLEFTNTSGTNGGALSSVAGATIAATSIQVLGNYATVDLAGVVTAGTDLRIEQPGITATSISVNNASNSIPNLVLLGSNTLSGNFNLATTTALDVLGSLAAGGNITVIAFGDLTMEPNSGFGSAGTTTLASSNGTFKNLEGAAVFNGSTGRNRIYASTDTGYVDGGINFTAYNPVAFGSDPLSSMTNVAYIAHSSQLPTMTVTPVNASRTYGAADPAFSDSFSGGTAANLVLPAQFQITNGPDVNVSTYTIQASGAISSTRALSFGTGTLTVTPATLTITANNLTRLQGAGSPAFSASFSGLVNGDIAQNVAMVFFNSQGFSTSPPGTYAVQPFGFPTGPNYTLTFVAGTLIIAPPPPPPPVTPTTTDPFETVVFVPGTITPTIITTTTETLTPTTLTPGELNATPQNVTVNPLIGTPLQIFGPMAETLIDQFAASFGDPSVTEDTVLLALRSPDIAPTIMVMLENLMYVELDTILDKPQSTWTADETTFVNGFLSYINAQRAAAATQAMADYEAWAKATVATENAEIAAVPSGPAQVIEMQILAGSPPVPPPDFLQEVSYGMTMNASQSATVLAEMQTESDAASVLNGTATAGYLSYLAGTSFQMFGKGFATRTFETTTSVSGNKAGNALLQGFNKMTKAQRAVIKAQYQAETGKELTTSALSKGTDVGADTTTETTTTVKTVVLGASDALEAVGRVISAAGVVAEVLGAAVQVTATAVAYGEQATYNDAFSAAVTSAMQPLGVSDLKTMMSNGQAMTYLMTEMAGGNTSAITGPILTAKPDMPLSQILKITNQL